MSLLLNPYAYAAPTGGFSPLSISWDVAYWAEGPAFTALGLADGAAVATWPDESGNGRDATQATASSRPTHVAAHPDYNNRPVIDADGTDGLKTAAFASALAQPGTVVVVGNLEQSPGVLVTGLSSTARWQLYRASIALKMFAGSEIFASTANSVSSPGLLVATYDGASSSLERDGASIASGNTGTHSLGGLTLFQYLDGTLDETGKAAFIGVKSGTLLTAGEKSDLLAWAQSHYGTP